MIQSPSVPESTALLVGVSTEPLKLRTTTVTAPLSLVMCAAVRPPLLLRFHPLQHRSGRGLHKLQVLRTHPGPTPEPSPVQAPAPPEIGESPPGGSRREQQLALLSSGFHSSPLHGQIGSSHRKYRHRS